MGVQCVVSVISTRARHSRGSEDSEKWRESQRERVRLQKRESTWGLCRPCEGGVAAGHSHSDPCRRRGGGTVVHRTTAPSHVSSAPGEARREVGDEGSGCIREPTSSLSPELQASLQSHQLLVEGDHAQPQELGVEDERESRGVPESIGGAASSQR